MQFIDSTFDIEKETFPTELEDALFKGCRFRFYNTQNSSNAEQLNKDNQEDG